MLLGLNQQVGTGINWLFRPISASLLPFINRLTRHWLLQNGVKHEIHQINGLPVSLYTYPSQIQTEKMLPILLLHGIADDSMTWALQIRALSKIGPVYAPDLLSFGLSGTPHGRSFATLAEQQQMLQELLANVIGRPTLVVGNSLGGWLAVKLAQKMPNLIRGIVLLNPGGAYLAGFKSWLPFAAAIQMTNLQAVQKVCHQIFGHVPLAFSLWQYGFQARFTCAAVQDFVPTISEKDFLQPADLQNLTVPVGLVWGLADRFLPPGSLEFFASHLPSTTFKFPLPGCGHLPQLERFWLVTKFIHLFVEQIKD